MTWVRECVSERERGKLAMMSVPGAAAHCGDAAVAVLLAVAEVGGGTGIVAAGLQIVFAPTSCFVHVVSGFAHRVFSSPPPLRSPAPPPSRPAPAPPPPLLLLAAQSHPIPPKSAAGVWHRIECAPPRVDEY